MATSVVESEVHGADPDLPAGRIWHTCAGLTLREAEELLDLLEGCGITRRTVRVNVAGFTVCWKPDTTGENA